MFRKMQIKLCSPKSGKVTNEQQFVSMAQCAVYELLVADSMSPNTQMSEKMHSIERLCRFLKGEVPTDVMKRFPEQTRLRTVDCYSQMSGHLQDCLRFAITCLSHRFEIVRISALKLIKFILETIGCQLDYGMVFILKSMLATYPVEGQRWNSQTEDFDLKKLFGKDISIVEYLFKYKRAPQFNTP